MDFLLNILGTASALPTVDRNPSAQVLDVRGRLFLIDCGEGVQQQLRAMHISFLKIDHIFISHLHGDHYFGIFGLLSTMGMLGRTSVLHLYAPKAFEKVLAFFYDSFGDGLKYRIEHHILDMESPRQVFSNRYMEVLAFPLRHRTETYGFLFREKLQPLNVRKEAVSDYGLSLAEIGALKRGEDVVRCSGSGAPEILSCTELTYRPFRPRSYAYCSDTMPFPELPSWVEGVDLLYHEATYPRDMQSKAAETYHSTTEDAAGCAAKAGAGTLIIGHYSSRYPDVSFFKDEAAAIFGNVILAEDCMTVEIPLKRE